ncbi:MAG: response regulator [Anaerolineae bacterium]|nr:response regulator [Anaerolineae bacterium]
MQAIRILYVEDDDVDQAAFKRMAQQKLPEINCWIAPNVAQAQQYLAQERFNLVIVDYWLEDGTALDVINQVKDAPTIVLTGAGSEEIAARVFRAGAQDYLIKDTPANYLNTLPDRIERTLQQAIQRNLQQAADREQLQVNILRDFYDKINHDLRTPLAVLQLSARIMAREAGALLAMQTQGSAEAHHHRLDTASRQIAESIQRIRHILDQVAECARLDMLLTLELTTQDLNTIIEPILHHSIQQAATQHITFQVSLANEPLLARLNAEEIEVLLKQVLANAVYYTPHGGKITLSTYHDQRKVYLEVRDTGQGIPLQHLPHVFERQYRVDSVRSSETGGAGLGLAVVKRIVELHQGTIHLESQVDRGTTLSIGFERATHDQNPYH